MEERFLTRAKEIIKKIFYITIATVSKDGQPWNTPVYSAYDENYNFFWASDQNGQHSKNIKENNQVFIVIYDSTVPEGTGEGVYIQAKAYELIDEKEIAHALKYFDGRVNKQKNPTTRAAQFMGEKPRRVYKAISEKVWMNGDGDINGEYIDIRIEVDLLKKSV
jgi:nitroimidazol reductase NimA-like FMN-containing flavoprotein (pyridoxamine 5'-phosphate oxidase superfamily)